MEFLGADLPFRFQAPLRFRPTADLLSLYIKSMPCTHGDLSRKRLQLARFVSLLSESQSERLRKNHCDRIVSSQRAHLHRLISSSVWTPCPISSDPKTSPLLTTLEAGYGSSSLLTSPRRRGKDTVRKYRSGYRHLSISTMSSYWTGQNHVAGWKLQWSVSQCLLHLGTDIQELAGSVPPVEQINPDDYFIILGKSDKKPGPHQVKLRLNPYWEDAVLGCYVRLDWICSVPLAILTWWTERWWNPWPGPQLMLQDPSIRKLQAYLECKEHCNAITDLKKQYVGYAIMGPQGETSQRLAFCPGEDRYYRNMDG